MNQLTKGWMDRMNILPTTYVLKYVTELRETQRQRDQSASRSDMYSLHPETVPFEPNGKPESRILTRDQEGHAVLEFRLCQEPFVSSTPNRSEIFLTKALVLLTVTRVSATLSSNSPCLMSYLPP